MCSGRWYSHRIVAAFFIIVLYCISEHIYKTNYPTSLLLDLLTTSSWERFVTVHAPSLQPSPSLSWVNTPSLQPSLTPLGKYTINTSPPPSVFLGVQCTGFRAFHPQQPLQVVVLPSIRPPPKKAQVLSWVASQPIALRQVGSVQVPL